jgi:hypothetical protein
MTLLSVPIEVRRMIYERLIPPNAIINIMPSSTELKVGPPVWSLDGKYTLNPRSFKCDTFDTLCLKTVMSLIRACRKIHDEVTEHFYTTTVFAFAGIPVMELFVKSIPAHRHPWIKKIGLTHIEPEKTGIEYDRAIQSQLQAVMEALTDLEWLFWTCAPGNLQRKEGRWMMRFFDICVLQNVITHSRTLARVFNGGNLSGAALVVVASNSYGSQISKPELTVCSAALL